MKKLHELSYSKLPIIAIDPALSKYKDKTLFPAKLSLANEQLKGARLPDKKHRR